MLFSYERQFNVLAYSVSVVVVEVLPLPPLTGFCVVNETGCFVTAQFSKFYSIKMVITV